MIALPSYLHATNKENYAQFRSGRFVIATAEGTKLPQQLNAFEVVPTPGYDRSQSVIVTLANGHREHWFNPTLPDYRKAHFSFLEEAGIYAPANFAAGYHVDHAFPKSAFKLATGLVKANFISGSTNIISGASWEKRYRYRALDGDGLCRATLVDLLKACDIPLEVSADPFGSMRRAVPTLIHRGIAPEGDRDFLLESVVHQMDDRQDQDTASARADGYDV
jgi:hypothetical protein